MADVNKLLPLILKFEGGYVNNKSDLGKCTNMGVTLQTWQAHGHDKNGDGVIDCEDVKLLTVNDVAPILKNQYWDVWKADSINNQSIANILVDWYWGSGSYGIKLPQRVLGVTQDGVVGPATISAINNANQEQLFNNIIQARLQFYKNIIASNPSQSIFLQGWNNRTNSYKFQA